jgi:long-subunit fatty acid transport protein
MRRVARLSLALLLALPALAQAQTQPPPPPTPQEPRPQAQAEAQSPSAPSSSRWFFGGGIGASFGDVDYVEIAPLIGYRVNPRISTGVGVFWRYRDDGRYSPSVNTNDYGGSVFAEALVARPIFVHAEYEYVNYEYPSASGGTVRDSASNFYLGAGVFQPLGGNVGFYASALYNLSYDANDLSSPYDSPWAYRFGVSVGF